MILTKEDHEAKHAIGTRLHGELRTAEQNYDVRAAMEAYRDAYRRLSDLTRSTGTTVADAAVLDAVIKWFDKSEDGGGVVEWLELLATLNQRAELLAALEARKAAP